MKTLEDIKNHLSHGKNITYKGSKIAQINYNSFDPKNKNISIRLEGYFNHRIINIKHIRLCF